MSRVIASKLPGELLTLSTAIETELRQARKSHQDKDWSTRLALALRAFHRAPSFFLTEPMFRTLHGARTSLPQSGLMEYDLPAPRGALYTHHPMKRVDENDQVIAENEEMLIGWWAFTATDAPNDEHVTYPHGGAALQMCARRPDEKTFSLDGFAWVRFSDDPMQVKFETLDEHTEILAKQVDLFRGLCYILRQPLVETTKQKADQKTHKRFRTEGRKPPVTRVISLRQPSTEGAGERREWAHSWVVRGHWRHQWYPNIQAHRPVWVASHVKGPEDKPLLDGTKVYKVER